MIKTQAGATFERLARRQPRKVDNPFMHSDFRGLIIADYQEAVRNCTNGKLSMMSGPEKSTFEASLYNCKGRNRKSMTTREVFPIPQRMNTATGVVGSAFGSKNSMNKSILEKTGSAFSPLGSPMQFGPSTANNSKRVVPLHQTSPNALGGPM